MKEASFDVSDDLYSSMVTGARDPATAARAYRALSAAANATVAVAAMAALAELRCGDEALEIFEELRSSGALALKGQSLDLLERAGTVALKACAAGGKWQEALEVLEHIRFRGLPLSCALYDAAVAACANQRDEARRLVGKMMAAGYAPSERALLAAELTSSVDQLQELERQGFSLPEDLVKAAIGEAKVQGQRDLARDLSLKLRVAKTGVPEPRATPKRQEKRRKERRAKRATEPRSSNGATDGTDDVELPEMDDWDQWDEDEDEEPKSWQERVTYF